MSAQQVATNAMQFGGRAVVVGVGNECDRFVDDAKRLVVAAHLLVGECQEAEEMRAPQPRTGGVVRGQSPLQFLDTLVVAALFHSRPAAIHVAERGPQHKSCLLGELDHRLGMLERERALAPQLMQMRGEMLGDDCLLYTSDAA